MVVVSSIAATHGSSLSGSYAGAQRMQWMLAEYASEEANRLGLNIRVHCLLPMRNPSTGLGRGTIVAYAERAGVSADEFARRFAPVLTPPVLGRAVADLHENPDKWDRLAYRVGGDGLTPLN